MCFWKGKDSYRNLQNAYFEHVSSKGFELERGLPSEETKRKHETIQDFKKITNFENTKELLKNITLELPKLPDINDIKLIKLNKEKIIDKFKQTIKTFIHSKKGNITKKYEDFQALIFRLPDKIKNEILEKFNDYSDTSDYIHGYFCKKYYKMGFCECMRLILECM